MVCAAGRKCRRAQANRLENGILPWGGKIPVDANDLSPKAVETTPVYLDANLALKEEILAKMRSPNGTNPGRYKPPDSLLAFLNGL